MDIIVTTPKDQAANAALEAETIRKNNGGSYFRRFSPDRAPDVQIGDRVFYVENGYLRGFALVSRTVLHKEQRCDTTGKVWDAGFYVFMDATTWVWIDPVPMQGFQGFRYAKGLRERVHLAGGWQDPKPEVT